MKYTKRAFTLIELLVVIAIIGILATVVIVNVASANGRANNSKVVSNLSAATRVAVQCNSEQYRVDRPRPNPDNIICEEGGPTGNWPYYSIQLKSTDQFTWDDMIDQYGISSGIFYSVRFTASIENNNTRFRHVMCDTSGCKKLNSSGGSSYVPATDW